VLEHTLRYLTAATGRVPVPDLGSGAPRAMREQTAPVPSRPDHFAKPLTPKSDLARTLYHFGVSCQSSDDESLCWMQCRRKSVLIYGIRSIGAWEELSTVSCDYEMGISIKLLGLDRGSRRVHACCRAGWRIPDSERSEGRNLFMQGRRRSALERLAND
jgi:hypothetical protein